MYNPKIEEFIAPVRAIRILKAEGLTTVREVAGCTNEELLRIKGFGVVTLFAIRERTKDLLTNYEDDEKLDYKDVFGGLYAEYCT